MHNFLWQRVQYNETVIRVPYPGPCHVHRNAAPSPHDIHIPRFHTMQTLDSSHPSMLQYGVSYRRQRVGETSPATSI